MLDVGHGNCTILRDGDKCAVIDAAPGDTLFDELEQSGVKSIEHLVLSHADHDHMGNAVKLLWDKRFEVKYLWYNPDGMKSSKAWERLARQAHLLHRQGQLPPPRPAHSAAGDALSFGRVQIQVLHPDIELWTHGPTKKSTSLGMLTANTLSIVLHVSLDREPAALLTADIDALALERIQDLDGLPQAPVLVFPHHGGLCGEGQPREFARTICHAVRPEVVIFSMARGGRYENPNPEIVAGVREAVPDAHIACTQLSSQCHVDVMTIGRRDLAPKPAAGRSTGSCCAGSVSVKKTDSGIALDPDPKTHRVFVDLVPSALCRRLPVPGPRSSQQ
ncbi:ComEC/Rec2 family competence protein [Streptomyces sp. DT199]|uniref:ComEC/Rec2 family competence protein n=1 Tax=Streptomyces sp. DT199 TaxID=3393421 RepID=UPI003CFBB8AC